jgi:hypothetical protein
MIAAGYAIGLAIANITTCITSCGSDLKACERLPSAFAQPLAYGAIACVPVLAISPLGAFRSGVSSIVLVSAAYLLLYPILLKLMNRGLYDLSLGRVVNHVTSRCRVDVRAS